MVGMCSVYRFIRLTAWSPADKTVQEAVEFLGAAAWLVEVDLLLVPIEVLLSLCQMGQPPGAQATSD